MCKASVFSLSDCISAMFFTSDQFSVAFTLSLRVFGINNLRFWSRIEGIVSRVEAIMWRVEDIVPRVQVSCRGSRVKVEGLIFVTGTFDISFTAGYHCSIKLDRSSQPICTALRTNAYML